MQPVERISVHGVGQVHRLVKRSVYSNFISHVIPIQWDHSCTHSCSCYEKLKKVTRLYFSSSVVWSARLLLAVVSFPADFSPSVGKSTSGNPPIPFRFTVFQSLLASRNKCSRHVHCTLTVMQSYVTSHIKLK